MESLGSYFLVILNTQYHFVIPSVKYSLSLLTESEFLLMSMGKVVCAVFYTTYSAQVNMCLVITCSCIHFLKSGQQMYFLFLSSCFDDWPFGLSCVLVLNALCGSFSFTLWHVYALEYFPLRLLHVTSFFFICLCISINPKDLVLGMVWTWTFCGSMYWSHYHSVT